MVWKGWVGFWASNEGMGGQGCVLAIKEGQYGLMRVRVGRDDLKHPDDGVEEQGWVLVTERGDGEAWMGPRGLTRVRVDLEGLRQHDACVYGQGWVLDTKRGYGHAWKGARGPEWTQATQRRCGRVGMGAGRQTRVWVGLDGT